LAKVSKSTVASAEAGKNRVEQQRHIILSRIKRGELNLLITVFPPHIFSHKQTVIRTPYGRGPATTTDEKCPYATKRVFCSGVNILLKNKKSSLKKEDG
jgi:hypothetical protein